MDILTNPFKQALRAGKPQIGLWAGLATPIRPRSAPAPASTGC